jgi:molybdopterin molybdotransferase
VSRPLLPLQEALDALLAAAPPPADIVELALSEAAGHVLARDMIAEVDVPPADNSAMDGYAVRGADAGRALPVVLQAAAGDPAGQLAPGTAARIFTGAVVPRGADAVVMQEDCERQGDSVRLPAVIRPGQHIRRRGEDTASGSLLLSAGRRLQPQDLGLLASQGLASVPVYRPLRVALLSTGSELRDPGTGLLPAGAIYNSNRPMLAAMLEQAGCVVEDRGIVVDSAAATRKALQAAAGADLILSSGGVSVGDADHVREQVAALGEIALWRIAIKPGKPFAFGRVGATPFIGVPGNPASAFVTFALLARPFIRRMQGARQEVLPRLCARADFAVDQAGTRTEFLRASLQQRADGLWVTPFPNQSSGVLRSLCASDALVEIPLGETVAPGDQVALLLLQHLLT